MIRTYANLNDKFVCLGNDLSGMDGAVWIDLVRPTRDEEIALERALGIDVPTMEEMSEIELSSRLYVEDGTYYMTANILSKTDTDQVVLSPISFILHGERIITVRYEEPRTIETFVTRCHKSGTYSADAILLGLIESIIERLADLLERAGQDLDRLSNEVFVSQLPKRDRDALVDANGDPAAKKPGAAKTDFSAVLVQVGNKGNLLSKIRDSLVSIQRLLAYDSAASLARKSGKGINGRIETITRDVQALSDHAGFLTQKITFLLDATLGMINIQQTAIIKIFSVAAVVFLPPTLIASIYGMNFKVLPELDWAYGYPFALGLMVLFAVLPYQFFKWRGWL